MKEYNVVMCFEVFANAKVEANSLEEAIAIAQSEDFPLPSSDNWEYIDGTFEVDKESTIARNRRQ